MPFWTLKDYSDTPADLVQHEDNNETWEKLLGKTPVIQPDETFKRSIGHTAVLTIEYIPDAPSKEAQYGVHSHGFVLDVDEFDKTGLPPYSIEQLRERLYPNRFVCWTTYKSTAEARRWRVFIPFRDPLPLRKFKPLWEMFNNCVLDRNVGAATLNPNRLGFYGIVQSQTALADYEYHVVDGPSFDWKALDIPDEIQFRAQATSPESMVRDPDWIKEPEALRLAKNYYSSHHFKTLKVGGRHPALFKAGCALWWDWAATSDTFVREVLQMMNDNFSVQKGSEEIETLIRKSRDYVFAHPRTDYGNKLRTHKRLSLETIGLLAKSLRRRTGSDKILGAALERVAENRVFAERSASRGLLTDICSYLAREFHTYDASRILDQIQVSLGAQRVFNGVEMPLPTDEEILSLLQSKKELYGKHAQENIAERDEQQRDRIRDAFFGARDYEYHATEYQDWETQGFTDRQWIVQHERSYYFFVGGDYRGPYLKDGIINKAETLLAPAQDRVKLRTVSDGKIKQRTIDELMRDYGTFVDNVACSLYSTKCRIDRSTSTLVRPLFTGTRSQYKAAFSGTVDKWLRALSGQKHNLLCQWLSLVPALDQPLAALVLFTPPGSGKNLLVSGISRLWSSGGAIALEKYTPDLLRLCPIIFCDELLPSNWRNSFGPKLRAMVSEGSRVARELYQPKFEIIGYSRLVFAANSPEFLQHALVSANPQESEAIKERVLTINHVDKQASVVLKGLSAEEKERMVEVDIPNHILWLRDTWEEQQPGRFGVVDTGNAFSTALTASDAKSRVFDWIYRFITRSRSTKVFGMDDLIVVVANDQIYVNGRSIQESWDMFNTQNQQFRNYDTRQIPAVIADISNNRRQRIDVGGGRLVWYRVIDLDLFASWAQQQNCSLEDLEEDMKAVQAKQAVRLIGSEQVG